eukprot:TRINITY_DN14604_c0_g1_i1.p1 TRINITY_DN14604_c0_g1~~TRINITY_DN14604_c0_g1_i1.p1  ORF type:complete len:593 (+),score=60.64 TRINITY_DN14604_c0_g1_i1:37-1815(+)
MSKKNDAGTEGMFAGLSKEFRQYHRNSLNVVLHLVTTPLGWCASLKLMNMAGIPVEVVILAYMLVVMLSVPLAITVATALLHAAMYFAVVTTSDDCKAVAFATFIGSYIAQDISHWLCGEPTFQSSYSNISKFAAHTFFLIPLCFDSLFSLARGPFYWLVPRDTTIKTKVDCPQHLETLREWVFSKVPNKNTTTHWWYSDLKNEEKTAFDEISRSNAIFDAFASVWDRNANNIEIVKDMNEVYVASPTSMMTSDTVFLMDHIDGPWIFWPFCAVYRVLVAVNENKDVTTHLKHVRSSAVLTTGDCMGFDFNREIHKVSFNPEPKNTEPRITLKLHYVVYPKCLKPIGLGLAYVTSRYDEIARRLFLYTIKPKTVLQKFSARIGVLLTTYLVEVFESFIGLYNVVRVVTMFCVLSMIGDDDHRLFLYLTSFVHYLTYISTYYYRSDVNYGRLLRDCAFWKTVSISQLAYWYILNSEFGTPVSTISIAMVVLGYGLAASATYAIGVERTYFGSELGITSRKWINAFPYNTIPHPMILGAVIALIGFYVEPNFRQEFPSLIPIHCSLYVIHALQEHFDIHDKRWRSMQRTLRPYN